jgi:hypothetical protein
VLVNGNLIGFGMLVVSAAVIVLPWYFLRPPDSMTMSGVGLILILMDLGLRFAKRGTERWLVSSFAGGYLFFIPVWVFGIAVIVLNVMNALVFKK